MDGWKGKQLNSKEAWLTMEADKLFFLFGKKNFLWKYAKKLSQKLIKKI